MTISVISKARTSAHAFRSALQTARREAAAYRALEQELASYQNAREIDDLLGVISHQEGPDADNIRNILTRRQLGSIAA